MACERLADVVLRRLDFAVVLRARLLVLFRLDALRARLLVLFLVLFLADAPLRARLLVLFLPDVRLLDSRSTSLLKLLRAPFEV